MSRLQHKVPQREPHTIKIRMRDTPQKLTCVYCGKEVIVVDKNEGSEGLKALLRF